MKNIVEAWKLIPRNPDPTRDEEHFWIVRHDDGTGNMVNPGGTRLFLDTTRFEHEPCSYLVDTMYYRIHPVSSTNVPTAT